jgi:hypothetical protein
VIYVALALRRCRDALLVFIAACAGADSCGQGKDAPVNKEESSLVDQAVSYFKNVSCLVSEFTQTGADERVYHGKLWLLRDKSGLKIKITYTSGIRQEILIIDKRCIVVDQETGREHNYSAERIPVYSMLTGTLKPSPDEVSVIENSKSKLKLKILVPAGCGGSHLIVTFSKYAKSGNIDCLEEWIVVNGDARTTFTFDKSTLRIGDSKQIPNKTFSIHRPS